MFEFGQPQPLERMVRVCTVMTTLPVVTRVTAPAATTMALRNQSWREFVAQLRSLEPQQAIRVTPILLAEVFQHDSRLLYWLKDEQGEVLTTIRKPVQQVFRDRLAKFGLKNSKTGAACCKFSWGASLEHLDIWLESTANERTTHPNSDPASLQMQKDGEQ